MGAQELSPRPSILLWRGASCSLHSSPICILLHHVLAAFPALLPPQGSLTRRLRSRFSRGSISSTAARNTRRTLAALRPGGCLGWSLSFLRTSLSLRVRQSLMTTACSAPCFAFAATNTACVALSVSNNLLSHLPLAAACAVTTTILNAELERHADAEEDFFKRNAYRKAIPAIRNCEFKITNVRPASCCFQLPCTAGRGAALSGRCCSCRFLPLPPAARASYLSSQRGWLSHVSIF